MSDIWNLLDRWARETAYEFCSWLTTAEGYLWLIAIITTIGAIWVLIIAKRRSTYRV